MLVWCLCCYMAVSAVWVPLRRDLKRLNSFHHRCVHTVLGITNQRQWEEHISSVAVREWRCGDDRDQADATSSRVARTPCQDAAPKASEDVPVWMAAPDTVLWRFKKKVEGLGEEGPEGYGDW